MAFPLPPKEAAVYETNVVQKMCPNSFSGHKIDFFAAEKRSVSPVFTEETLFMEDSAATGRQVPDSTMRVSEII